MKRNINNARKDGPSNAKNLLNLKIPHEYTPTTKGELFLMFDSGPSQDRILIFSTVQNLELMKRCDHWYVNDTSVHYSRNQEQ